MASAMFYGMGAEAIAIFPHLDRRVHQSYRPCEEEHRLGRE